MGRGKEKEGEEGKGEEGWFDPPLSNTIRGPCQYTIIIVLKFITSTPTLPSQAPNPIIPLGSNTKENLGDKT